jgi:aspartyl-tRNA(Asn)/glutamyl-tRNA(Gln) amidotransferase subunit C
MPEAAPPKIGRDDVAHLARLSRLALTDAELDQLAGQLDVILGAVAQISEVTDAADVPPTSHAVPLENVTRPDVVMPSLTVAQALSGAPAEEDGRFRVPRILDEE